ncbi:DUF11 domain-containing protein [Micromonospora phytophila]|uniref:DUF11 domain-containing protein n=1 Tax=Micromonospora phytophila TaxID=709888 RepID=UPI00202F1D1C|nr:DUF11 domain-containing protein [Micromonospora phytophila]MCM0673978.1 DUF11 domain-containing protein [Micromonospora phytophila]
MSQHRARRKIRTGLAAFVVCAATVVASGPALAAPPPRADLRLDLTANPVAMLTTDQARAHVVAVVDNIGAVGVEGFTVTLAPPAGSRIIGDPSWQCDHTAFVCTHGPVPAGGTAEPLSVHLALPVGPEGAVAAIGATAATTAREATRTNNTDRVDVTYQLISDLTLQGSGYPDAGVPTTGGDGSVSFTVRNAGTGTAQDLRLVVEWPAGVTRHLAPVGGTTNWQCEFAVTSGICTAGPLAAGATAGIYIPLALPAGTVGQEFTVRGTVTTSGPEWQTDANNVADVFYRYAEL